MILTGKAKEDFLKYVYGQGLEDLLIRDISLNALIIDWLDSIGYVIEISTLYYYGWSFIATMRKPNGERVIPNIIENTRQEATKQAIIKANEIYNNA